MKRLKSTNLRIDQQLLRRATQLGGHKTKREAMNAALEEYIQRRDQTRIIELFGRLPFDRDYNYKKQRRVR